MSLRRWLLLGVATVIVVAVVAVVVVVLFLRSLNQPGEASAKFIPHDAPFYASINFRPGLGQIDLGREVISLLETDKLIDVRDDFLEQVEHETGVHLLDDVRTWLGINVSFAVLDADPDSPEWIVIA